MIDRRSRVVGGGLGVAIFALTVSAGEGCTVGSVGSRFCTLVDCSDETAVTLHTVSGTWAPGMYSVEVVAGPLANACTFAVTAPMSDPEQISCSTMAIPVTFEPFSVCTSDDDAGSWIDTCQGVPVAFHLLLSVPSTSPRITIAVARDGQPVGGGILVPQYHTVQPNGPGCDPTCQEAAGDMVVGG
jgi:hypothetical protein